MTMYWACIGFGALAILCFTFLPLRSAILLVLFGGWWGLPVGNYAPVETGALPWWITGIALPSDMLLTKAWIPPLATFAGAALRDGKSVRHWRPTVIDIPMAAWCAWPLLSSPSTADPPGWISASYIAGAWGLPWLLGRIWLTGSDGAQAITKALALSGLVNLPVAVIEGLRPAMLYGLVYGPHPFRFDGVERYIGYRPIGFMEHGNLYGLWAALAAFASIWLARRPKPNGGPWTLVAVINTTIAVASQSVGAIVLLCVGLGLLALWRLPLFTPVLAGAAALLLALGAVHFSGVVPLQTIARSSTGQQVIGTMRSVGRGSFLWRFSQDSKALALIGPRSLTGTGEWDWWRASGTRPWGQALLLIGQFGVIGWLLAWGALLAACTAALTRVRQAAVASSNDAALPLALVVLLALADAGLNAFFFYPAIFIAGAIAAAGLNVGKPLQPAQ